MKHAQPVRIPNKNTGKSNHVDKLPTARNILSQ
jgi:hypothetical protein